MTSSGCIVHYALARTIIVHGTELGGLYYVDETTPKGQAMLTHGNPDYHLWMWHRRLGHPSFNLSQTFISVI